MVSLLSRVSKINPAMRKRAVYTRPEAVARALRRFDRWKRANAGKPGLPPRHILANAQLAARS